MSTKLLKLAFHLGWISLLLVSCAGPSASKQITTETVGALQELKTIQGPSDGVASMALSPDGSMLAYGSYADNSVHLINISSGEETMALEGHTAAVSSLAFTPDGQLLASTGTVNLTPPDGTVRIWEVATGKELGSFETSGISQLAFSPDGLTLAGAGGGDPAQITVWDVKKLSEKEPLQDFFSTLSFSPDGKLLATASRDESVHLLDLATGKEMMALAGHKDWVTTTAFSPSGKQLASGSYDQTIHLWDVETGEKLKSLTGHESKVYFLVFSPDGSVLASLGSGVNLTRDGGQISLSISSQDKIVRFWDVEKGEQIGSITVPEGVSSVAFDSTWTLIATGDGKGLIQFWGLNP